MHFITDIKNNGEPDILTLVNDETLIIKDLDGKVLLFKKPVATWTHESLCKLTLDSEFLNLCKNGADAYLGNEFVGSTEI